MTSACLSSILSMTTGLVWLPKDVIFLFIRRNSHRGRRNGNTRAMLVAKKGP